MSKLFNFTQPKGKWHKFISFNLGGRARLYKNIAQKLLAVSLCMAVVLLGTPVTTFADAEPTTFITAANANHWGRSDLRAYLNGVVKDGNTLPIDTTQDTRKNSGYYESQFSAAEYALVQPFKYHTNVLNSAGEATSTYAITDRFWLPSGNLSSESNQVLSWGATDVSRDSDYADNFDSAHAIPVSYWSAGVGSSYSWLRSPHDDGGYYALSADRGHSVTYSHVGSDLAPAASFKLDLSSVIFASAASAASLVPASAESGSRRFDILESPDFGKKTTAVLPDYGMYLKQKSESSFEATGLSYSAGELTVSYSGGGTGQSVVVQAFKQFSDDAQTGDLVAGTTSYEAAQTLTDTDVGDSKSIKLNVSDWTDANDQQLANLAGYTIKVWMEDGSGVSSLAAATEPVTFVGSDGSITKTETDAATNQRVFAMKKDLQTSWGDLQALRDYDETAYNNVIAGKGQDGYAGDSTNSIHGLNPTNQKIYFGTDSTGAPLEFWIAGRETYGDPVPSVLNGDGTIDPTGEIMTLYQAKSVQPTKKFNASTSHYDGNGKTVILQLADGQSAALTDSGVVYPEEKITATVTDGTIDKSTLVWQHRAPGATAWTDGMPNAVGTYELRCYAPGVTGSYEQTYSSVVTFTINGKSLADASISFDTELHYYTGDEVKPTIAVTLDGSSLSEGTDYTVAYSGNTNVGEATVTITGKGNFEGEKSAYFTISYHELPEDLEVTVSGGMFINNVYWFADDESATVLPPTGYTISTSLNDGYDNYVQIGGGDTEKNVYLKRTSDGALTDKINLSNILKWDSAPPEGEITLGTGNPWTDLINKITFGLFFKEAKTATITASDSDSGSGLASIAYYVASEDLIANDSLSNDEAVNQLEQAVANLWTEETNTNKVENIKLNENSKNVVYAKLTDNVGKTSYISSTGIVLYSDSQRSGSGDVTYTKLSGENPEIKINLNGNTINEVKLDNKTLSEDTEDTDYSVSTQDDVATISLFASKLDKEDAGVYTVTVSFNPQGETFDDDTGNDAPDDVSVTLTIQKATPTADKFTFSSPDDLTYNGQQHAVDLITSTGSHSNTAPSLKLPTKLDKSAITVKYYTEDGNLVVDPDSGAACAPKDVGTYTVKIDVQESDFYTKIVDLTIEGWTFTIKPATLTVAITAENKTYDGEPDANVTEVQFDGVAGSETLAMGTDYTVSDAKFVDGNNNHDENVGTNKKVTATIELKNTAKAKNYTFADGSTTTSETTADISAFDISSAAVELADSTLTYTGSALRPGVSSVKVKLKQGDDTQTTLEEGKDYTVEYSDNTDAGKATVTIKGTGNFTGSANTTFTITTAAPNSEKLNGNPTLTATYGQTLGDITAGLASAIGSFLDVDGDALEGEWLWSDDATTKVGNVGENKFTAIFTPTDDNYAKTTIDVTVKVSVDTSKWGEAQKRDADGKTQYVDSAGKTSVEIARENLDKNGILWLREESVGTSAWYGIDLSTGAFDLDKGLRFYVQWLSPDDAEYAEIYAQLDEAQKERVEDDNGWIFLIGVENPDGEKVQPTQPVSVYVQIGDDWDADDLNAYYITSGGDENVPVDYLVVDFPEGASTFGIMTLSHFSPYFIFDELTDAERAALELKPVDGNNQPTDKPNSSGTDLPGTGDISTELLISGLAIVLVSSLGVMLRMITNKKKFEE